MSQSFEASCRPDTAAAAIAQHLRVKTTGALAVAGSTDVELGTMEAVCTAAGPATVRLRTALGTCKMIAVDAITKNNPVYAAASGKISASGTVLIGIALEASTADGDVIEVLRRQETSDSAASGGTTAAAFEVDSDGAYPSIELASQSAGTGDFKATIKPPSTLTAARVFTLDGDAAATIANVGGAQTLTSKTLTGAGGITSSSPSAGIGYETGAGGAVSQVTNRTTGVTLNTISGKITTQATSLAAQTSAAFTVTNSRVAIGDVIVLSIQSGPTGTKTIATVTTVATGSFEINLFNTDASVADTGAAIINFAVLKAVAA